MNIHANHINHLIMVPAKFKSYLLKMQFVRNHADYSAEGVRKKAAWQQICFAADMISIIEKELNK